MEFQEYPKRVYKGDESIIVNTVTEENEFLGVKTDDKENKEGVSGEIGKGEESQQVNIIQETSEGETCKSGNVQTHEGQESPVGVLKRKPGRPPLKRLMDETGFKPK